jgi:tetratricopeptide (TPR) repeat protein
VSKESLRKRIVYRARRQDTTMAGKTDTARYRRISELFSDLDYLLRDGFPSRRFTLSIVAVILTGVLAIVLNTSGPRLYRDWRQKRLLDQAASLLQEQKFDEAARMAREVVKVLPDSLPAYYILAEATEKQSLEETVSWRAQIARLLPKDLDSQLNLASAALRFGQIDRARQALDRIAPGDRDRAAFHVVAGWLARAQGNLAEQEKQFAAAVKKEPGNDVYQFNLAVLQIHSTDVGKSAKARETLARLSKVAPFRTGALRALLNDTVARNDLGAADNFAQQLQMSPEITFVDYLLCLNFYRKLDEKKFRLLLDRVKPFADHNSSDLSSLMNWMNENGLAVDVVKWVDKLPPEKLNSPPVSIAVADAYAAVKNWVRLKRWTRSSRPWGEAEYLRLAYQAIATRHSQQNGEDEFQTLWSSAEQAANDQPERELDLARLASKSNLEIQSERLWWRVANNPPMRREALDALRRLYRINNNLEKLYDILKWLHESSPNEAPITADLARLGLNMEKNIERSHQLAREAYDRAPDEVNCAVTYAFSLDRLGRSPEGFEIIQKLPSDQLHDPHAAVYMALLLLDANQSDSAREYIASADEAKIYVEEKQLLSDVKAKLAAAAETPAPLVSPSPAQPSLTPTPAPTPLSL